MLNEHLSANVFKENAQWLLPDFRERNIYPHWDNQAYNIILSGLIT